MFFDTKFAFYFYFAWKIGFKRRLKEYRIDKAEESELKCLKTRL